MNSINDARKPTAGLVFQSGRAWLRPEVLQNAIDNKRKREELENAVAQQSETAQNKQRKAYEKAWLAVSHLLTAM